MKENIVIKYRHTALSYLLSTLIPWAFWLAASYGTDSLRSRMNLFKTSVLLQLTGLYGISILPVSGAIITLI